MKSLHVLVSSDIMMTMMGGDDNSNSSSDSDGDGGDDDDDDDDDDGFSKSIKGQPSSLRDVQSLNKDA